MNRISACIRRDRRACLLSLLSTVSGYNKVAICKPGRGISHIQDLLVPWTSQPPGL